MGDFICKVLASTEFWSALIGAIVGGLLALGAQMIALRAVRKQREEDHKRTQQALANSLLFKMMRIHSNFGGIHRYIEESFDEAKARGLGGPSWQFLRPFANVPPPVDFSPDEMAMLLAQKDDGVFNAVLGADGIHNSYMEILRTYKDERKALMDRLTPQRVQGDMGSGELSPQEMLILQPRIIDVSSLAEQLRTHAATGYSESTKVLDRLHKLLKERLGLPYKIEAAEPVKPR
jgi:hypothetical protein